MTADRSAASPHDPIICLISSYREGTLIQGAIRSALPLDCPIIVYEGATSVTKPGGPKTDLGKFEQNVFEFYYSDWADEASKRNAMLSYARGLHQFREREQFWILTLDADEILLWAEYLPEWLDALRPGYPLTDENIVPLKLTVPGVDEETRNGLMTWIQPSRLVHSSLIDRYDIGLLRARTPDDKPLWFAAYRSEIPPAFGEPHIHHRYYLRRGQRNQARGTLLENRERDAVERRERESLD